MRTFILTIAVTSVFTGGVAFACEPIGEPKPWYASGLAHFVAAAVPQRANALEVFADLVVGRNGLETMPPGPIVLVPWSHDTACKPLVWHQTRDGVWSPPPAPALYTGRLRNREAWVFGMPTVDIEMARLQPVWLGGDADRQRFGTSGGPLLTPLEFFDFYRILPTSQEFDARQPQALARVEAWESTHSAMAGREPVRSMLRTLRTVWARSNVSSPTADPRSLAQSTPDDRAVGTYGEWSPTVDGVRGRLVATAFDEGGNPQLQLHLELENVRERTDPIEIQWGTPNEDFLQLTLEDESAAVLPQLRFAGNRVSTPPFWLQIPVASSIRITISKAAYEYGPAGRIWLRPLTFVAWEMPARRAAKYYLRATLTPQSSRDATRRPWLGPLTLPRVALPQ